MPIPKVVSKTPLYDRYKRAGGQFNYTQWKEKGTPSLPMSAAARALAAKPAPAKAAPVPVDPTAWLNTPDEKTVDKQVQAETYSKYHPQFQQFIEARNISKANEKRIGDWYGEYAAEIKAGAEASRNAATSAAQATSDASKTLEAGAATEQAARQAAANADAKTRGATAVDFTDLANRASLSRQSGANASASLMRDLGTNAYTRSQGIAGSVVGAQKVQAKTQELGRQAKLEAGRTDLIKQMGDYRIANKEQRRKTERDYLAAAEALKIKSENTASLIEDRTIAQKLAQDIADANTPQQRADAEEKLRVFLETQRHNKAMEKAAGTSSDLSPAAKAANKKDAQKAVAAIGNFFENGKAETPSDRTNMLGYSEAQKKAYKKQYGIGVPPPMVELIKKNGVTPSQINDLTRRFNVPRLYVEAALKLWLGHNKRINNITTGESALTPAQWQELASQGITATDLSSW